MPEAGIDWAPREHLLSYEEILRIVTVAARRGLRKVRITGGEPLVRRGIVGFVEMLSRVRGLSQIAMTTNGVFLAGCAADLYQAGLRQINISLDSLNPATFAQIVRRDLFDQVWEGIEAAERAGFSPIKINVVLQQGVNHQEVVDFARLTLRKPYHVRFIEYMPCAQWETWVRTYKPFTPTQHEIEAHFGPLIPVQSGPDAGPSENMRIAGAPGVIGFIHAVSHDFCDTCNRVRLTAEGAIRPCLFSEIAVDFKTALRGGCDDQEIDRLLNLALRVKPEYHELDMIPHEKKLTSMVNIGG
jgi:cyclic pyranopterin phosphate synthase